MKENERNNVVDLGRIGCFKSSGSGSVKIVHGDGTNV